MNRPISANTRVTCARNNTVSDINLNSSPATLVKMQVKKEYIIKPAPVPPQRNVGTMCKVIQATKGVSCKPQLVNKEVQTDAMQDKTALILIQVPIAEPFGVPLPTPVPVFIPTTRNSANGIMKEVKIIQAKIPTDPSEADLLNTAEMVAGDIKEENTDSESEEDTAVAVPADAPTITVISSVQSLATMNGPTSTNTRATSATNNTDSAINLNSSPTTVVKMQVKKVYIIKPAPVPPQRNVGTICKVIQATKGVSCKPQLVDKEVQTDAMQDKMALILIQVPIAEPFGVPLPTPVPVFIPTTRNSANGIMKEVKKIQAKIPTDPSEAELHNTAEMVAGDKKEENTDSESEEDTAGAAAKGSFSPEPFDTSKTFRTDVQQMALKMKTVLDNPEIDLEKLLPASIIPTLHGIEHAAGTEGSANINTQLIQRIRQRQAIRDQKRPGQPLRCAAIKRGRRSSSQMEMPKMAPHQPPAPADPIEKPDANMRLKYTFGVNVWQRWITTKKAELDSSSSQEMKLFKTEILQLTDSELNYLLCLFVQEVRQPSGKKYSMDIIFYLCLGIQQYLYVNGKIADIFYDLHYEKFTDCLEEVIKKFILYNDSHYIETCVEEEHLWETKQLGAQSPHGVLRTLVFFNMKHFNLTTVEEHMQLSFSHMKLEIRNPNQPGTNKVAGSGNVVLRFDPPQANTESSQHKKVYELQNNEENSWRCPVKLYNFYLTKCPKSVISKNDGFYLLPGRSCEPNRPVWYSTMPLPRNALEKILHRFKLVKREM